ncbi:phosphate transport system regulatory protein PhoU [Halorubrum californiense DSM 19288]|uniref:Phosphate-specific transport system accessory protein PhoU n=1 Tax=Halorubrum californiense DSM 19288 TaxID=1227465 RepID=M0EDU2_9EURY|nr:MULTISPECIES: phosphate signaling complex protein PhoU [Halorubrum]ELZ45233.1 phosphate transport system regulatory protein PhoU [Halorubrum californiense DSM 19288]TKX72090.1 phosphate signaling complex protein PhoU [Halorubrum sp. GN11GM_10-3_MGM]
MPREQYQDSLDELRADVLAMGDQVIGQVERSLDAVERRDESLAQDVVDRDAAVNETYLRLEDRCVDLFALQQPVAGDLRFVTASFKIITDLERIGDLAVNLADYLRTATQTLSPEVQLGVIGEAARDLLERSLAAYEAEDAAACRAVATDDDEVDALCQRASESVTRDLIAESDGDGWEVERVLDDVSRVLLTVRDLERVADHAVNIAARTLYMIENDPELLY